MTRDTLNKHTAELRELCDRTGGAKSQDYASAVDTLDNFKQSAANVGTSKYQSWYVFFDKHVSAISNAIKRNPEAPEVITEPLKMRIVDAIVYLQLLNGMLTEDANNQPKPKRKYQRKPKTITLIRSESI
jgi:hypothetical protein